MKCIDPKLCYTNQKGLKTLRHFSLASPIIKLMAQQVFDCGTCFFCRKKRAYELAARCVLHSSLYPKNCFITLTYDEKIPSYHNNFEYADIQKFTKRLRQHCWREEKKKIEVFNVHEYGKNGKKHWHLIVFNHDFADKKLWTVKNHISIYTSEKLKKIWPYGHNTIGDVSTASAMYQAQYCEKDFKNGHAGTNKKSQSKHSGIGKPYFLLHYNQILRLGFIPIDGKKMPVPRYFQKIAHKHYSHFYEKANFFDLKDRKAIYRPFKIGEENKEIADLFVEFKKIKQEKIKELEKEWDSVIMKHIETGDEPEFVKSGKNALYDFYNQPNNNNF